ncbi:MAG: hypothetical protein E7576_03850 [Ruminococcaceae bacterium]|jgi:hypothetical protein|nr:hypothetical protein [Oscillospiraceae bacterium]
MKIKSILGVLTAVLLGTLLCVGVSAADFVSGGWTYVYVNPLNEEVIAEEDLLSASRRSDGVQTVVVPTKDFVKVESIREAGEYVRSAMVDRKDAANVRVYIGKLSGEKLSEAVQKTIDEIVDIAFAHTSNPKEGDYLSYQFDRIKCGDKNVEGSGVRYSASLGEALIPLEMAYYTDAEEEREVDEKVDELIGQLRLKEDRGAYDKVRDIYGWIVANVTYDSEHKGNLDYLPQYTAHAALFDGTCVCQGYANLFYRLALEADVDARIISGKGNGENHAWNIVCLDGWYYHLDSTWDSLQGKEEYIWFLKGQTFPNHVRSNGTGQGERFDYTSEDFNRKYPVPPLDYDLVRSGDIKRRTEDGKYLIGDVDGSGEVNRADLLILSRYLAGWKDYDQKIQSMDAANVDGEGEVTAVDRMILLRYLSHWDEYTQYFWNDPQS